MLPKISEKFIFAEIISKGGKYDDEDEDYSALVDQLDTMSIKSFQDYSRKFQEGEQLPKPKGNISSVVQINQNYRTNEFYQVFIDTIEYE